MKILIATGIYPPDIGGPATFSKSMYDALTSRGHDVRLAVYTKLTRGLPKGLSHVVYFFYVLRQSRGVDIIFAQDPVSVGFPAALAASTTHKKFVVRIAGDYAWEQGVNRFGVKELLDDFLSREYGLRIKILQKIERFVARSARVVIVPSEYLKRVVTAWGVEGRSIRVVYNGISIEKPTLKKEDGRKLLHLSDGDIFISIGRFVPWKGFEMLIRLLPDFPATKLVILGDGPQRVTLEALRDSLKLTSRVLMPGAVSKEVLRQYLASADVFLLNTGYEGYSHQLLEAMAAKVPIITTPVGGNKELVTHGENALIAEYNNQKEWKDRIEQVMDDEFLRTRMVDDAYKTVERYTVRDMINDAVEVLEQI